MSNRADACECGAGALCPVCRDRSLLWSPIACYREAHDGKDVLIGGGTYLYDAETIPTHRPFSGTAIARRPEPGDDEWRGGFGSEYDGEYWHKPEWFMRIPPLPAKARGEP